MSNESFISHAQSDLQFAKIGFYEKYYNQAIFHLQQANEKLAKEILKKGELFDLEELKKFSHHAVKPFIKFIKNDLDSQNKIITQLQENLGVNKNKIISDQIIEYNNSMEETIKLGEGQINRNWEEISEGQLYSIFLEFDELLKIDSEFEVPDLGTLPITDLILEHLPILNNFKTQLSTIKNYFNDENNLYQLSRTISTLIKFSILSMKFFPLNLQLNLILSPHVSESRYPSLKPKPSFTYDENNLLIKNFERIAFYTEESINNYLLAIQVLENIKPIPKFSQK